MPKELRFKLEDKPGALAALADALGRAGVNIDALAATGGDVRILVADASAARKAAEGAGLRPAGEADVVVADLPDKPGELSRAARRLADAGINIESTYVVGESGGRKRVGFAVRDAARARSVLGQ